MSKSQTQPCSSSSSTLLRAQEHLPEELSSPRPVAAGGGDVISCAMAQRSGEHRGAVYSWLDPNIDFIYLFILTAKWPFPRLLHCRSVSYTSTWQTAAASTPVGVEQPLSAAADNNAALVPDTVSHCLLAGAAPRSCASPAVSSG